MAGALTSRSPAQRAQRSVDALWRFLRRPSLAITLTLLLLGLLLLARFIPQIPGQAAEDPASAMRWLNAERDGWGAWGGVLRTLGLFNVTGSPLFFALLALLTLVGSVHLAAQIAAMRLPRLLEDALHAPAGVSPLPLEGMDGVHRLRVALDESPQTAIDEIHQKLEARFGPSPLPEAIPAADGGPGEEVRMLATSGMRRLWLRPLLPAGALVAVAVLWVGAVFGWNVRPPTLAPGETFISQPHNVTLSYTVPANAGAQIDVAIAGLAARLEGSAAARLGNGASVRAQPGAPALLLRSDGPLLALPGESESRAEIGLVFPQPGSEQIVLLPESGAGVRIVRLPAGAENAFLVELYARDGVQPLQRVEISEAQTVNLPLEMGDVPLHLEPTSGMNVTVRSAPGWWLFWPALVLMIAGAVGLLSRPRFVLAQLQPWPVGRSVLTLQSSDEASIAAVVAPVGNEN